MNDTEILIVLVYGLFILLWSGYIILYRTKSKTREIALKENQEIYIYPESNPTIVAIIKGEKGILRFDTYKREQNK